MRSPRLPSTKSHLSYRIFVLDALGALLAPLAALFFRNPLLLERGDPAPLIIYTLVSFTFCTAMFAGFRLANSLPRFFSFHDSVEIAKAAIIGVAAATIVTFSATRLDEIPRSVPAVHLLLLLAGMNATRLLRRTLIHRRDAGARAAPRHEDEENVIVVGANKLAWFYVRMLDGFGAGNRRIVAILDDDKGLHGRSISGHTVLGSPDEAGALILDFALHGTPISSIVVCERDAERAEEMRARLHPVCTEQNVELEFLAEQLGIAHPDEEIAAKAAGAQICLPKVSNYFKVKRVIDIAVSATAILVFLPILTSVAFIIFAQSGTPVVFWQRRVGKSGRSILIYKFRTMRKPVDRRGRYLSDSERRSKLGAILRATRLDELPQLFNVLNGSMSLIGPRPLLPIDQPEGDGLRLLVAPGITGWAQVHGGNLISAEDKRTLDEYYVQNASLGLDVKIVWRTISTVLFGDAGRQRDLHKAIDSSQSTAR
jgi:lipopolysaccharide/colanic/teichoic acid biosynthesis glycosyltransferase